MAGDKLTIYQIYYDEKSRENCYSRDWWHPISNEGRLTVFFENSVIVRLIQNRLHEDSEYFGVFSHDIKSEIPFKHNGLVFSPESLLSCMQSGEDVFSFQSRRSNKNIVLQAEQYHPGFVSYTRQILNEIGYDIPKQLSKIVLFNHFVAKSDVYAKYVNEMLIPAMDVMLNMKELYADAGYKKRHKSFSKELGFNHYPYHPFICERLMSVWLEYNKEITFKQIF